MTALALPRETRTQLEDALAVLAGMEHGDRDARRDTLYAEWYARPRRADDRFTGPDDLVELLRAAHAGFHDWQPGWRVEDVGARGQAVVRRGTELRLLERCDYSPSARRGLLPRRGDEV